MILCIFPSYSCFNAFAVRQRMVHGFKSSQIIVFAWNLSCQMPACQPSSFAWSNAVSVTKFVGKFQSRTFFTMRVSKLLEQFVPERQRRFFLCSVCVSLVHNSDCMYAPCACPSTVAYLSMYMLPVWFAALYGVGVCVARVCANVCDVYVGLARVGETQECCKYMRLCEHRTNTIRACTSECCARARASKTSIVTSIYGERRCRIRIWKCRRWR